MGTLNPLAALACFAWALSCSGARAESALVVTWPEGWTVSDRPMPIAPSSGRAMTGWHRGALKTNVDGLPVAAITIASLVRGLIETTLDIEIRSFVTHFVDAQRTQGMTARCEASSPTTLAGLSGGEVACETVDGDEAGQRLIYVMALGETRVYSLVFKASAGYFDSLFPAFQALRGSLRLSAGP